MEWKLSRRNFLKFGALGLSGLALNPLQKFGSNFQDDLENNDLARVCIDSISVYDQPNDKSRILYQRFRDELVNVYYEVISEYGPDYNPVWYRVWDGFIHSSHMTRVKTRLNSVVSTFPETGLLTEVTVPLTQSKRYSKTTGWEDCYRLYYGSTHWVRDLMEGPDGEPWYKIEDELDGSYIYYAPAIHLRPVADSELAPISPDVAADQKYIEVSLAQQTLTAYEGSNVVLHTRVSTGLPDTNPAPHKIKTNTPSGEFHVSSKMPSKHMGDGFLTADIKAYELPGVPWVTFFEPDTGVAFHGTYWHTNYGTPMSHGCVNMRNEEAKWIFRWTTPVTEPGVWEKRGYGTRVVVH